MTAQLRTGASKAGPACTPSWEPGCCGPGGQEGAGAPLAEGGNRVGLLGQHQAEPGQIQLTPREAASVAFIPSA